MGPWTLIDSYKIVNVYKPPPTRLQSQDLLVFSHRERLNGWEMLIVLPSYTLPKTPPAFTPAAGTLASIQI